MGKITIKKFLCFILSIITIFSLSIKVNAAQKKHINLSNLKPGEKKFLSSDEGGTYYISLTDENEKSNLVIESDTVDSRITSSISSSKEMNDPKSNKINENLNKIEISCLKLNEKKFLSSDKNGIFYITLVNENEMTIPYANLTSSNQKFVVTYENFLTGITLDVFNVSITCDWFSSGENSRIVSLRGKHNIISNQFSCYWNNSYIISDFTYHVLGLDVYHNNGTSAFYVFKAIVDCYGNLRINVY